MHLRQAAVTSGSQKFPMGGFTILQPLPSAKLESLDPFILLHHGDTDVPAGIHPNQTGVGPHPHRGFSPVTFLYEGEVHHRDSRGNSSVIGPGGTQWLDAGMGITHSERASAAFAARGGHQELIQLWVNTPAAKKFDQPRYQGLTAEDTPTLELGGFTIGIVTGEFEGTTGPIDSPTPVLALRLAGPAGAEATLPIPPGYNCLVYVLKGGIKTGGTSVFFQELLAYEVEGDAIALEALHDTTCLVLAGKPIGEPVAQNGPFVLNNETQLLEAYRDAKMGKMGVLIEEF